MIKHLLDHETYAMQWARCGYARAQNEVRGSIMRTRRAATCRVCLKPRARGSALKRWQRANKEHIRGYGREWIRARRREAIRVLGGKCIDCGCVGDCNARDRLEFDHVPERGKKAFGISDNLSRKWASVLEELKKCDLVCRPCHHNRTKARDQYFGRSKKRAA